MLERTGEQALPRLRTGPVAVAGVSLNALNGVATFARKKPLGAIGGAIMLALVFIALFAPVIAPYGSREIIRNDAGKVPVHVAPSSDYPMGTDYVGRDIFSRIIHGARISLYVGFGAVAIGITGAFIIGIVSAYAGGPFDLAIQRIVDAKLALPGLIIALAIRAALGASLENVIIAIIFGLIPVVVRTVRSQVLSIKEMDYITAARAVGATPARIVFRHIAPNCFAIYLILATYYMGFAIILEATLSFLGVGAPPDSPSWGGMLNSAVQEANPRVAPWTGIFPGLTIFIVVMGFNLLGDAMRDVMDPRLRRGR